MFSSTSKYLYTVNLPTSTSNEVLEWFEIMENNNQLVEALIELVHNNIKFDLISKISAIHTNVLMQNTEDSLNTLPQKDFIDSLYNWTDSNSAIFREIKEEKKDRKKMLSV